MGWGGLASWPGKGRGDVMLIAVAGIIVLSLAAGAIALVAGARFTNWRQILGGLLPGWPWW